MSIFRRLFNKPEQRAMTFRDPDGWLSLLGGTSKAGVTVTADSAMSHPAVMGAVRLVAELTASLPIITYERTPDGGKKRATYHPVYELLHDRPNPQQTPFTFKETLALHLLLHGNAFILIDWGPTGRPVALWPIHPNRVTVEAQDNGSLLYKVTTMGQQRTYTADDMLHVPLLPVDGLTGHSPVQMAREAIGAALAAEEYAATYYANSARPSGVLKVPGALNENSAKRLKESWQAAYGRGKSHGTAVLEEGTEFQSISSNAEQAQLLESRRFAMRAIAAALRIPPHFLDPEIRSNYANVETSNLEFLVLSLQPFLVRLEQAFTLKLFTPQEREKLFVEFLTDSLLRTDTQTRYQCYQTGIAAGFLTVNEVRRRENLDPLPDGDKPKAGGQPLGEFSARTESRAKPKRQEILGKHLPRIEAAANQLLEREYKEVTALAEKALGVREDALLDAAVEDYYEEPQEWMLPLLLPAFTAMGLAMGRNAAEEAGTQLDEVAIKTYIAGYVQAYLKKHCNISKTTLLEAIKGADSPLEAIREKFEITDANRGAIISHYEGVKIGNLSAMETWKKAGITKIEWVAGAGACPMCKRMNGKIVGIGEPFVSPGETIPGAGGMGELTARKPRVTPPLHLGCDCTLRPVKN